VFALSAGAGASAGASAVSAATTSNLERNAAADIECRGQRERGGTHHNTTSADELVVVVVHGMPKTATTSLKIAFNSLGLPSGHWAIDRQHNDYRDYRLRSFGEVADARLVSRRIRRALREGLPPLALLPPGTRAVAQKDSAVWSDATQSEVHKLQGIVC